MNPKVWKLISDYLQHRFDKKKMNRLKPSWTKLLQQKEDETGGDPFRGVNWETGRMQWMDDLDDIDWTDPEDFTLTGFRHDSDQYKVKDFDREAYEKSWNEFLTNPYAKRPRIKDFEYDEVWRAIAEEQKGEEEKKDKKPTKKLLRRKKGGGRSFGGGGALPPDLTGTMKAAPRGLINKQRKKPWS